MLRRYSTHREGREMPVHVHWVPLVERICTIAAPGRAFLGAVCDSNYMLCNGSRDNRKFGSGRWVWRRIIDDKSFPLIEHRDEWGTRQETKTGKTGPPVPGPPVRPCFASLHNSRW